MAPRRRLVQGRTYSRKQIRTHVGGGGLRDFLPHRGGEVLAVCLDPKLNLDAPAKVDVAPGPQRGRWSRAAVRQKRPLPVFLKRAVLRWEYVGHWTPTRYVESGAELARGRERRAGTVGVLRMRKS